MDIWRNRHTKLLQYTWRQRNPPVSSRLDMWLIHQSLVEWITKCDIRPAVKTDHMAVSLQCIFKLFKRGPGTWKLNTSILSNTDVKHNIIETITKSIQESRTIGFNARQTDRKLNIF